MKELALPAAVLLAMAAQSAVAQSTACFAASGTTICDVWSSYQSRSFSGLFTTVPQLDAYVREQTPLSSNYTAFFAAKYQCPGLTTAVSNQMRYQATLFCGLVFDIGSEANCAAGSPQVCRTPFLTAYNAVNATFRNTAYCAASPAAAQLTARNTLFTNLNHMMGRLPASDAASCIKAVSAEASTCGFATAAQKTTYCASNASEVCCGGTGTGGTGNGGGSTGGTTTTGGSGSGGPTSAAGGDGSVVTAATHSPTGAANSQNSGYTQPGGFQFTTPVIVGIAAGGAVLIGGIILIALLVGRRKRNADQSSMSKKGDATATFPRMAISETMEVVYNYVPNLNDEIYLYVGDPVIVKCKFDDGWAFGFNMTTKMEGSFPLACLAAYNGGQRPPQQQQQQQQQQQKKKDYKKRQSSLYGVPDGLKNGSEWGRDSQAYGGFHGQQQDSRYTQYTEKTDPRYTQYTDATRDPRYTQYTDQSRMTHMTHYNNPSR
ncbi:hypothetical protein BJ742DRAFT_716584 [Cladochytrium replicatum]|nr:hypothetical protein BJ742DRAFT_716584 [Cladochytrium replicatum]